MKEVPESSSSRTFLNDAFTRQRIFDFLKGRCFWAIHKPLGWEFSGTNPFSVHTNGKNIPVF
jgi:hypothetical protein